MAAVGTIFGCPSGCLTSTVVIDMQVAVTRFTLLLEITLGTFEFVVYFVGLHTLDKLEAAVW